MYPVYTMTTESPVDIGTLITSNPAYKGGRPTVAGTGLTVREVARRYRYGQSVEQIVDDEPDIPAAALHAAVTYYLANRAQIDAEIDEDAALYERLATEARAAGDGPGSTHEKQ